MSSCNDKQDIRIGLCRKCDQVTLFLGDISLKLNTDSFLKHAKVVKMAEEKVLAIRETAKEEKKGKKLRNNSFLSLLKA